MAISWGRGVLCFVKVFYADIKEKWPAMLKGEGEVPRAQLAGWQFSKTVTWF